MDQATDELDGIDSSHSSRPSREQVHVVVEFMEKHTDLANGKMRDMTSRQKAKKLWSELANIANAVPGTTKSTAGWMRYWIDKKCMIKSKRKLVEQGNLSVLSPAEEKIWKLCFENTLNGKTGKVKKKRTVKVESSDDESSDEVLRKKRKPVMEFQFEQPLPEPTLDTDDRQTKVMEDLVQVMDKQATALAQMSQAAAGNAHAMDRLADASLTQARAVESLANTFAMIGSAVHDVRNAILSIDFTLKRCYNVNQT